MTKQERNDILVAVEAQSSLYFIAKAISNTPRGSQEKVLRESRDLLRFKMQAREMGVGQKAIADAIKRGRAAA